MATTPENELPGRHNAREALRTSARFGAVVAGIWFVVVLLRWLQAR